MPYLKVYSREPKLLIIPYFLVVIQSDSKDKSTSDGAFKQAYLRGSAVYCSTAERVPVVVEESNFW